MRPDFVHLAAAFALHDAARCPQYLHRVVVLLLHDSEHGVHELGVRGVDDGLADKTVCSVYQHLLQQPIDRRVHDVLPLDERVVEVPLDQIVDVVVVVGAEILPDGSRYAVVVVAVEEIQHVGKGIAHGHDVVHSRSDAAADAEQGGHVRAAHADVQDQSLVWFEDVPEKKQLLVAALPEGDLLALEDRHAVEDDPKPVVSLHQRLQDVKGVPAAEFRKIEAREDGGLSRCQPFGEPVEMLRIPHADEHQGDVVESQLPCIDLVRKEVKMVQYVLFGQRKVLLLDGVLAAHHQRCDRQSPLQDLLPDVLRSGHVEGGPQAIL